MSPDTEHLAPENPGARCRHLAPGTSPKLGKWSIPEKSFQNAVQKCLFQVASALQSKVMAQTWLGHNFAPCILPCKIGGSQNLMKERYLSKTPFLTFVYISKCDINLPGYFGNSKKRFLWTGLVYTVYRGIPEKEVDAKLLTPDQLLGKPWNILGITVQMSYVEGRWHQN